VSERLFHLAQINVARAVAPLDDPSMAEFVAQLDAVNAVADASPGFRWRLKSENGRPSSYVPGTDDDRMLINLTVWDSVEALRQYVYRTHEHAAVFRDRRKWFEVPESPLFALWWVTAGHIPTVEEGFARLARLRECGPTADAFTFKATFPPPGVPEESRP
jgi:hypothetical protein